MKQHATDTNPHPSFHVEYIHGQKRWVVRSEDTSREPLGFVDHDDAVRRAFDLARQWQSAVYIHGGSGAVVETYGPDGKKQSSAET